jgi:hypothetical protein
MAWDTGTITSATPWAALSQKLKDLITGGSGVGNWSFVKNIAAGVGLGQSGSASYSLDLFRCRGATTLYERVVQKNLASNAITTDGTSFVHTITTPPASRFITVLVVNTKATTPDDPTGVTLDGSNAPTFTKIKSQVGGSGTGDIKLTLWIGKASASAPTGTQLTVAFGANTQTGCMVIVDEWQGVDLTLAATSVDPTGAAQIGIQVVGGNGTTETAHSATLAAFLGNQSVAVTWAAQTASAGTYTAEQGWTKLAADFGLATPTARAVGAFRPDPDDTAGVMTLSSATAETSWAAIAFEFQRKVNTSSITNANDAGKDWYFIIEIPVPDGAVTSVFNCCEDYDGFELFRRMPPAATNAAPVGLGWRDNTLTPYATVPGNNRPNLAHQILNTSGFSYWIKLTPNLVTISTRVGAAEAMNGAMLLDSFVTNAPDLPLIVVTAQSISGNSFSRLPGVTVTLASSGFACDTRGWTSPVVDAFTTNAAFAQDLWSSNKIHDGRIMVSHQAGRSAANALTMGFLRGLWKTDFLCFARGGTVLLGDTQVIAGNTWTVISNSSFNLGTGQPLIILTRAT